VTALPLALWLLSSRAALASDALDVLVLDDGGDETADLVAMLEAAGHTVTCSCDDGLLESDFDGAVYSLSGHDVVVWLDGGLTREAEDMPQAGQEALVAWVAAGGGLVHQGATSARSAQDGENAHAEDLMLVDGDHVEIGAADFEIPDGSHPAAGGFASGDTFQLLSIAMVVSEAGAGTTVVEWAPSSEPEGPYEALVVADLVDGRVAQFGWIGHVGEGWSSNLDYTDTQVVRLFPDAVQYVALRPPTVDAGGPYSGEPGDFLLLSGSGDDPDGGTVSCGWDLDEDGLEDSADLLTTFDASAVDGPLSRTISLVCQDDEGEEAEDTAALEIINLPPEIQGIDAPTPAEEGEALTLEVTYTDPEPADTHTATWDLGDGTERIGDQVTHTYAQDGSYTVEVVVTDDDGGSDSRSFAWTVHNQAPTVVLEGEQTAWVGEALLFLCSATDPGGDTLELSWSLGDGTEAGDVGEVTHAYVEAGVYAVRCMASDGETVTTATLEVSVSAAEDNAPPGTPELLSPWNGALLSDAVTVRVGPVADPEGMVPLLEVLVQDTADDATVVALPGVVQGATETAIALPALSEGSYRWQVRAIDDAGLEGAWSVPWYFAVEGTISDEQGPTGCACTVGPSAPAAAAAWWLALVGALISRRSAAARWGPGPRRGA